MSAVLRVLHLVGSTTDDLHLELSRLYAASCLDAVRDPARYEPLIALVSPDGTWRFPSALTDAAVDAAAPLTLPAALDHLVGERPDVAVPQMFCDAGLTHHRALLALLGIPSVGNGPTVMATSLDKAATRAIVAAAGVDVPAGEVVRPGASPTLSLPVVVKPVATDNSVGVSLVRAAGELDAALARAWAHGDALVESYVELGREVRCGTIVRDGRLVALPVEEYAVDPVHKPVRDARDKLARDAGGRLRLVAKDATHAWIVDPDDPVTAAAGEVAVACHRALGCGHHGLFDLRIDPAGRPWFLEAGPYCSFGANSVVPTMAAAAGIPVTELFADAVAFALHHDRAPTRSAARSAAPPPPAPTRT